MSKLGLGSRTQSAKWVCCGRVSVNGRVVRDPEFPVRQGRDVIAIDGRQAQSSQRRVILLNKPRGLVTTTADDQGRETVYRCFAGAGLPWLAPVGRLDKASEGLLLFTNDPEWAARLSAPESGVDKVYHVQIDRLPDEPLLRHLEAGVTAVRCLRQGARHAWLEIVLQEGRNRQIRRLLEAADVSVLRLLRVSVGSVSLGHLAKGQWRELSEDEIRRL